MKIKHVSGATIDTNTLPDVDSILMEKSKELHELFAQYDRQLLLVGEMKGLTNASAKQGCIFFHIAKETVPFETKVEMNRNFWGRLNQVVLSLTRNEYHIARNTET